MMIEQHYPIAEVQPEIAAVFADLTTVVLEKNESYGNSGLNPICIFDKDPDPEHGLNVRIDDKLKRIYYGQTYLGDNDIADLIGYLTLKLVLNRLKARHEADLALVEPASEAPARSAPVVRTAGRARKAAKR